MSKSIIETMHELRDKEMIGAIAPLSFPLTPRTITELQRRYHRATKEHGPMVCERQAMGVLDGEVHELRLAIHARDTKNIYEEMADCANTCIRWMQEMEARGLV